MNSGLVIKSQPRGRGDHITQFTQTMFSLSENHSVTLGAYLASIAERLSFSVGEIGRAHV